MKKDFSITEIVNSIRTSINSNQTNINLHEPLFGGNEWVYVKDCLVSTFVSSVGKYVDKFEAMLAEFTGMKKTVAVVNGTAALHISLLLSGVEPDDEVILPSLTFIATANAVSYCGAIPHFADSNEQTLGVDPSKLNDYLKEIAIVRDGQCFNRQTGRHIKAVFPVHTFGHPVDLDHILEVCNRFSLVLIEDAAESLGSYYKNKHTGNWGKLSALSFNGNKTVTTGGGGAILTNDENLAKLAKHIITTARVPHRWEYRHDIIGYNYRMPNLNAALGCAQLEQLPDFLKSKRALAHKYQAAFADLEGVSFFTEPEFATSNYWLNAILLDEEYSHYRDEVLEATNQAGFMTRPAWTLMSKLPMYLDCPKMDLSTAENIEDRLINIPSSAFLADEEGSVQSEQ